MPGKTLKFGAGDEENSRIYRVRNEVSQRVKEDGNIVRTTKRRKANWIGHILHRKCLLKHVIEGYTDGRSDGNTRKKTSAVTIRSKVEERILETERGSTRSNCLKNWLWKIRGLDTK
jgi:hypothetical protein